MRKIFTVSLFALATNFAFSQDDGIRNFRFGLKVSPSINWLKPDVGNGNIISNNGAALRYGGGLIIEYRLAKIISFQSGVQIDVSGGKTQYNNGTALNSNSVSYYYSTVDDKIVTYDPAHSIGADTTIYTHYQLNSRNYSTSYITVPLTLKMKTKEIGSLTYYGQFGINNSFRWKSLAKDDVSAITRTGIGGHETKTKLDVTKDVSLYTAALNMGIGAEMNLAGSTSLTFGLNYLLGFTNMVKNNSDYLERTANVSTGPTYTKMPQQVKSNAIVLMVGVLF